MVMLGYSGKSISCSPNILNQGVDWSASRHFPEIGIPQTSSVTQRQRESARTGAHAELPGRVAPGVAVWTRAECNA
jgi:hypothetical protein